VKDVVTQQLKITGT